MYRGEMEDVCEISSLMQEEYAERDMQEKELLMLESGINIEENRYRQEKTFLKEMIQNRQRVKSRALQTSDTLDIILSRLDENLHPCICDNIQTVVDPQIEAYYTLKEKHLLANDDVVADIHQLEHNISMCEEKIKSGLLHETEAVEMQLEKKRKLLDTLADSEYQVNEGIKNLSRQLVANEAFTSELCRRWAASTQKLRRSENDLLLLDERVESLQNSLRSSLENTSRNLKDLQLRTESVGAENAALQSQINRETSDMQTATANLETLQTELENMSCRIEHLVCNNAEADMKISTLRERIHQEEVEVQSSRGSLEIIKNRISAQIKIARAFDENITLSCDSGQTEVDNSDLRESIRHLHEVLQETEKQVSLCISVDGFVMIPYL